MKPEINFGQKSRFKRVCDLIADRLSLSGLNFKPFEIYANVATWEAESKIHPLLKKSTIFIKFSEFGDCDVYLRFPYRHFEMSSTSYGDGGIYKEEGEFYLRLITGLRWEPLYEEAKKDGKRS